MALADLDMCPTLAIENIADLPARHIKPSRQPSLCHALLSKVANGNHIRTVEPRSRVPFALRAVGCSMQDLVSIIILPRRPTKIVGAIIRAAAIIMGNGMDVCWSLAVECHTDELMDVKRLGSATKANLQSTYTVVHVRLQNLTAESAPNDYSVDRSKPAKGRNFVAWMIFDWLPDFCFGHLTSSFATMIKE